MRYLHTHSLACSPLGGTDNPAKLLASRKQGWTTPSWCCIAGKDKILPLHFGERVLAVGYGCWVMTPCAGSLLMEREAILSSLHPPPWTTSWFCFSSAQRSQDSIPGITHGGTKPHSSWALSAHHCLHPALLDQGLFHNLNTGCSRDHAGLRC